MLLSFQDQFKKANQLWYVEGKTAKARAIYKALLDNEKQDPLLYFQLGRMAWSFEAVDSTIIYFQKALQYRHKLCLEGREDLEAEIRMTRSADPFRFELPVEKDQIDVEQLDRLQLSPEQWHQLASASRERQLYGIALYALDKANPDFTDASLERDKARLEDQAAGMIDLFDEMNCAE